MEIKLFQDYDPKEPVENIKIDDAIQKCWQVIDQFFDFDDYGFMYEYKSNSDISSNKAIEENTIAVWLLLNKIDFSETKISKKDLIKTIDIILERWDNEQGIPSSFSKKWKKTSIVPDVAKYFDLALAVLKVCRVTREKKYIYFLINILKFVNSKYKLNKNSLLHSKNIDGNISWSSIKYVLLLNEINSFFNIEEYSGMYEPELSDVILNNNIDTFQDFKEQLKLEAFNTVKELHLILGKSNSGFYLELTNTNHINREVKLYGNSIIGISLIKIMSYGMRDITRNIDQYLNDILSLTNNLWDPIKGGYYRTIDFTGSQNGEINKSFKNIISNIVVSRFLVQYISYKLDMIDINNIDKVGSDLLQLTHQLDVTVNKLTQLKDVGILEVSNDWSSVKREGFQLHPIYLQLDLLVEYKTMNDQYAKELLFIRDKIGIFLHNNIFLSHSSKDKNFVRTINVELAKSYNTFYDEEERAEKKFNTIIPTLKKGIEKSSVIVFFVTENFSAKNRYIQFEIEEAIKQKNIRGEYFTIIVLKKEGATIPKLLENYWIGKMSNKELVVYSEIIRKIPSYIKRKGDE